MIKTFSRLYTLAVFGFLVFGIRSVAQRVGLRDLTEPVVIYSVLIYFSSLLVLPTSWYMLIKNLSKTNVNFLQTFIVYSKSWLGRYIPGKAGWVLGRMIYGESLGISKKNLAASSLLEILITTVVLAIVAVPSAFIIGYQQAMNYIINNYLLLFSVAFLGIIIFFLLFRKLRRRAFELSIKLKRGIRTVGYKNILLAALLILIMGLVASTHFILLLHYFSPNLSFSYSYVVSLFFLSSLLGIVALFAPAGIGVRELILSLGLSIYSQHIDIVTILIYSRLITIAGDMLLYFTGYLLVYLSTPNRLCDTSSRR